MSGNGVRKYIPFFGCLISTKHSHFEAAVRRTAPKLGMELVDVAGFTCCPDPIYYKAADTLDWLTVAARNLSVAEDVGHDVLTCCSGCTLTLSEANHTLTHDDGLREKVNQRLKKVGREFKGTIRVRHIATVLRDDVGMEAVSASVSRPLEGLRVAIHYGCHLLKPERIMRVEDPARPVILQNLLRAIGAEPVFNTRHMFCCGKACQDEDLSGRIMHDNLTEFSDLDVDALGLICPTCFDEYDLGQIQLSRKSDRKFRIPVFYYFQLLGLAQGFSPDDVGLKRHKVSAKPVLEKLGLVAPVKPG
ncbi:MAG TPA: CoB--CoM heterodisulfide reductase iron-sulfur subunit B family protein [Acidobacteriota bacterium]|nr:CoB--CoM heterodisulfide reductase iron-sulfur subunit B family protein [Acidobacteriota bacterium]